MKTEMDVLVMEDCLLLKKDQPIWQDNGDANNDEKPIDNGEVRKIGLVGAILLGGLMGLSTWLQKPVVYLFGGLFLLSLGCFMMPVRFHKVYRIWMQVAHILNHAITTVILWLTFYLAITPVALLKRLFGGRPLPMKPEDKIPTYWKKRSEMAQAKDRFIKRY